MKLDLDPRPGAPSGLLLGTRCVCQLILQVPELKLGPKALDVFRERDRIPDYGGRFFSATLSVSLSSIDKF
jgi:hypothetical protein